MFFKKWPDLFKWMPQKASTVSVAEYLPGNAEKFCNQMNENYGINLLPLKYMGLEDRYIRFGLGRTRFRDNLRKLHRALNSKYRPK